MQRVRSYEFKPALIALCAMGLVGAQCSAPVLSISEGPRYDYGPMSVGTSKTKTFIVTNTGGFDAILGPVSSSDLGLSAPFALTGGSCVSGLNIPIDESCTLDVQFSPTAAAFAEDRIVLRYNWLNNNQPDHTASRSIVGNALGTVAQISAGSAHTCALLSGGKVRCWGGNSSGELGYGNTNTVGDDEVPAAAGDVSVGGAVMQIAAGLAHTCAVLTTGKLRCWGSNSSGQLGYGHTHSIGDDELPSSAGDVSVGGNVTQVSVGYNHSCALLDTGKVRCWGAANIGQLGYGFTDHIGDDELPSSAGDVPLSGSVVQIAAGTMFTCALLDTGKVRCWGENSMGHLGYGNTGRIYAASSAGDVDVGGTVVQIAAGGGHVCALLNGGSVRCWGYNLYGQLGYGRYGYDNNIGDDELPSSAGDVAVGGTVTQIEAGHNHTCAVLATGAVRCWGEGRYGRLGYGNTNDVGDDELPSGAGDVSVGSSVTEITAGGTHTCAWLSNGNVRCWGSGFSLGYGNTDDIGDDELPSTAGDVPVH